MKTETLELIIEELAEALNLERWRLKEAIKEISELKKRITELEKENYNA